MAQELETVGGLLTEVNKRLLRQEQVLGTLIRWIVQSSASPLSRSEAETLLELLDESIGEGG